MKCLTIYHSTLPTSEEGTSQAKGLAEHPLQLAACPGKEESDRCKSTVIRVHAMNMLVCSLSSHHSIVSLE